MKKMKRKSKDQIKTISKTFYDVMKVGVTITLIGLMSQGRNSDRLFRGFAKFSVSRIKQMLREQKMLGYIVYDEEDEYSPILLTQKGFSRLTKERLRDYGLVKWDHFWRIISFDIPEKKVMRRKFQYQLKSIGCYKLQRSVYVYPHDCKKDILHIASGLRISKYVSVFVTPNLSNREKEVRDFYFKKN